MKVTVEEENSEEIPEKSTYRFERVQYFEKGDLQ
jgi:hypothetical protein